MTAVPNSQIMLNIEDGGGRLFEFREITMSCDWIDTGLSTPNLVEKCVVGIWKWSQVHNNNCN